MSRANAILPAALAPFAQIPANAEAAIGGAALLETAADQRPQPLVAPATQPLGIPQMGVEAALGHFQRLGQCVKRAFPPQSFHDGESCGGLSADKMLQAFVTRYEPGWTRG